VVTSSRARARLAVLVIVVLAAASMVTVLLPLLPPRQTAAVPLPAPSASPETVVRTYLAALNAHDCTTATELWAGDQRDIAGSWCTGVAELTGISLGAPSTEPPGNSSNHPDQSVTEVPVTFDLRWRRWHGDPSLPEGRTTWGYLLAQDAQTSAWRIVDNGTG